MSHLVAMAADGTEGAVTQSGAVSFLRCNRLPERART